MALNSSTVAAGDVTLASQYNNARKDIVYNAGDYATATGSANTYAVTLDGQITAYSAGLKIRVKINVDNTSASTINVNSLGAKTIKKNAGAADVAAGDLQEDGIYDFVYDGTNFQVQALAISGLPSVASQGDILYYNGSSWVTLSAGTSGQKLQTSGAAANPSWADVIVPPPAIYNPAPYYAGWTDDLVNIPVYRTNELVMYTNHINAGSIRYVSTTEQSIGYTTINASLNAAFYGMVVKSGYVYILARNTTGSVRRLFRADLTTNIQSAGNWAEITLSGTNIASSTSLHLCGYGDGAFWFVDSTNSFFIKATLSGTTLTEQSTVTVTGCDYTSINSQVTERGIWAWFASGPRQRFASFSGTLSGKQILSKDGAHMSFKTYVYMVDQNNDWYIPFDS